MLLRPLLFFISLWGFINLTLAQTGGIKGKVIDKETGEELPFANVVVQMDGSQKGGTTTDFEGQYTIKPLAPGKYDLLVSFIGYASYISKGVLVKSDQTTYLDISLLPEGVSLDEVVVVDYVVPLIDPDNKTGGTVTKEEIQGAPTRDINSLVSQVSGVYQSDAGEGLNIKGGRTESTVYYVDGIKVTGSTGLPNQGIEQVSVITGGLPAQYGDVTGGVVSITTSGPSRKQGGGFELITSQFLDPYGYNLASFSIGGPLLFKKQDSLKKESPIAGFFLAGEVLNVKDPSPSVTGVYKVNDSKIAEIKAAPLQYSNTAGGFVRTAEYVTFDDMELIKARQNVAEFNPRLSGKIDVQPTSMTNFQLGGTVDYSKSHDFVYVYSLFNPENNPENLQNTWRMYARFTQKFKNVQADEADTETMNTGEDKKKSASNITNAFYEIQADYEEFSQTIQDDSHKDKLFDYGYIGAFETHQSPNYTYGTDSSTGLKGWLMDAYSIDSVTFTPGTVNENGAAYAVQYYDNTPSIPTSIDEISANNAVINGSRPVNVYDNWFNVGRQYNDYFKGKTSQFRLSANASADFKSHAIRFGVEYEQKSYKVIDYGPIEIWNFMRQYANSHISELDKSNPELVYDGDFFGEYDTIKYARKYVASEQTTFDKNLRESLGLNVSGTDWIDIDNMDPSKFSLDMFSAEELIAEQNGPLRYYYGYDYKGNKMTSKKSLSDFFNDTENRPIPAYEPIYMAGYIQDKFDIKDLKFNFGLRFDRYDANQMVLRDKYSIYDVRTLEDVKANNQHGLDLDAIPSNIGDDYVLYVNDPQNPNKIVGFRNNDTWYDSEGEVTSDPGVIASKTSTGTIAPYLSEEVVYNSQSGQPTVTVESFKDFEPEVNISPRAAFSFPISDVAQFFAHYDVLAERPKAFFRTLNTNRFTTPNRMDPLEYLYFNGGFINNPNLKSVRTIDYQVGFKQTLGDNAALSISAFYRELKDLIQAINVSYAYPMTYQTYDNLDFGTVKGFTVGFDMRRSGNVRLTASYTLQFANGTGSSATTGLTLVSFGLPNLRTPLPLSYDQRHNLVTSIDYRYASGKEYNGPRWFGKPVFENTGANLQVKLGSGTPYSRQTNYIAEALITSFRRTLKGSPNSARMPWSFNTSIKFDRQFKIKWGKKKEGEERKENVLITYLQFQNLFNNKNVLSVYRATGNASDDGYLASAEGQSTLETQLDPQAFEDLYEAKVRNYIISEDLSHYSMARTIRLGLIMDF